MTAIAYTVRVVIADIAELKLCACAELQGFYDEMDHSSTKEHADEDNRLREEGGGESETPPPLPSSTSEPTPPGALPTVVEQVVEAFALELIRKACSERVYLLAQKQFSGFADVLKLFKTEERVPVSILEKKELVRPSPDR